MRGREYESFNEGREPDASRLTLTEGEKRYERKQASARSMTRYEYLKLDTGMIRLIRILASSTDHHSIECGMKSAAINQPYSLTSQSYDALSYEWADARSLREIILDEKIFYIR